MQGSEVTLGAFEDEVTRESSFSGEADDVLDELWAESVGDSVSLVSGDARGCGLVELLRTGEDLRKGISCCESSDGVLSALASASPLSGWRLTLSILGF